MRKLVAVVLTILTCGAAYALPLGNPSEASLMCDGLVYEGLCADFCQPGIGWCDAWSFRVGFYGDYVFERHMEEDTDSGTREDLEHFEMFTNAGYLAVNFYDRIDIFGTLGATNMNLAGNSTYFGITPANHRLILESDTDFSWSIGLRGTLWECGCFSFGAEAQYFYTRPDLRYVGELAAPGAYPDGFIDMKYQEWQLGLGVAYRIWNFVPYAGVKFSHVNLDMDNASVTIVAQPAFVVLLHPDGNHKHQWGYAIGVSIVDCEKAALTVEARYPDETALYVNGQIRF